MQHVWGADQVFALAFDRKRWLRDEPLQRARRGFVASPIAFVGEEKAAIAKMRPPNRRGTMSRMNAAEEIVRILGGK